MRQYSSYYQPSPVQSSAFIFEMEYRTFISIYVCNRAVPVGFIYLGYLTQRKCYSFDHWSKIMFYIYIKFWSVLVIVIAEALGGSIHIIIINAGITFSNVVDVSPDVYLYNSFFIYVPLCTLNVKYICILPTWIHSSKCLQVFHLPRSKRKEIFSNKI